MITQHRLEIRYLILPDGQLQVFITCGDTPENQVVVLHTALGMALTRLIQPPSEGPAGSSKINPN